MQVQLLRVKGKFKMSNMYDSRSTSPIYLIFGNECMGRIFGTSLCYMTVDSLIIRDVTSSDFNLISDFFCSSQNPIFRLLTLTALGGGGAQKPPSTNFAVHAKPPRFQPRRFMTFFFEVLRIFWHQVCKNRTCRYGVTWPFATKGQPEKWDFFHFVYKTNGKVNFLFWPVNQ